MKTTIQILAFLLITGTWMAAKAGGYQVRLQGQKQTGIGLIGTPFAFGASSIFYNPGALPFTQDRFSASAGVSGIFAHSIFQKSGTDYQARSENSPSTPFYAYFSGKIGDQISLGIGAYTPFGSSGKWEDDWDGRYLIQEISLQAIFIQPTVAWHYQEKFGIGAGFIYAIGNVELKRSLYYNQTSSVFLEGSTTNIGFNIGAFFKPIEDVTIGIDYRSRIDMKVSDGDATFYVPPSLGETVPRMNKFKTELPLPANLDFGLAMKLSEKWDLAFEINWVFWSAYDTLSFEFEQQGALLDSDSPRNYRNSVIPRIGVQYRVNDVITLRGGAYYDTSPTDDEYFTPETVSLNTVALTAGASITPAKGLSIDLSYLQLFGLEAEKSFSPGNFSGTYKTISFIPGIGLSYTF
jgi:long-chain fatty acid transport protein